MRKLNLTFLLVVIVLFTGCMAEEKGQLTRVDVEYISGKDGYVTMITESESIEVLRTVFEKIKWTPSIDLNMVSKADVKATLFFEFDKNMPERLYEYEIWFNENDGTVTVLSNNEKEGYGVLDKDNARILQSEFNRNE